MRVSGPGGFDDEPEAGVHVVLAHQIGHVALDGALDDDQFLGDLRVGHTLAQQVQDVLLGVGDPRHPTARCRAQMVGDQPGGRVRGDGGAAVVRRDDGAEDVVRFRGLVQEAVGVLCQCRQHGGVIVEAGQDHHRSPRRLLLDARQQLKTVHAGHTHIGEHDVDVPAAQEAERVRGGLEGAQQLDLGRVLQVCAQCVQDVGIIVHRDHPDGGIAGSGCRREGVRSRHGLRLDVKPFPSGVVTVSVVPSLRSSLSPLRSSLLTARDESALWHPTQRTHLLHLGVAMFLFVFAYLLTDLPREPMPVTLTALACVALPVASAMPAAGLLLSLVATWIACSGEQNTGIVAAMAAWGTITILIGRGYPRWVICCFAFVVSAPVVWAAARQGHWSDGLVWVLLVGFPCVVLGELLRRQRDRARQADIDRRRAMVRQRRLVASELHDTVARDLSYAVMTAERLKLAHSADGDLVRELSDVIGPVRTAVGQLRRSLQIMTAADNDDALLVPSFSSPRPIDQALDDARRLLSSRGAVLEVEGVEFLGGQASSGEAVFTPGTNQQVLRVVNELIDNAVKYTCAGGRARIVAEVHGDVFECMVANDVDARPVKDVALSSGIGLEGTRHRVETLGGEIITNRAGRRWVVAFAVPTRRAVAHVEPDSMG